MLIIFFASLLVLGSGAFFKWLKNVFLTGPLIALATGVLLGPIGLNIVNLSAEDQFKIIKISCEFTIAMALMATALRLSGGFIWKNLGSQLWVLFPGMLLMCGLSTLVFYWFTGSLSLSESLLIGAVITPTDPVIASALIAGDKAKKYMPLKLRNTISFESGSNDGLAYPLVLLSIYLFLDGFEGLPVSSFLLNDILYATVLCAIAGYVVGLIFGRLMHFTNKRNIMNKKSLLPFSLALSFFLLSGFKILGMNGILAVFAGGIGFTKHLDKNEDMQEERIQESMERIFTIPVFFLLGIILPWKDWLVMGWTAVMLIAGILLFRRLPAFLLLQPVLKNYGFKLKDGLILGWFGPIGAAALYYALEVKEKTGFDDIWVYTVLIVTGSTLIHGITSLPFEKIYGKQVEDQE
ncbi:cation:proton antiporter [Christiangramia aquimixticola]